MSNIGIMDAAFFVGKNVLLAWLNDFFQAGYTKVEQMSTGAMACQILDAIYPGKVPLGKVNFDAKSQPESVANFKVLQGVFDKEQISKYIDVSKLLNGKFQDNLEFLQWLKSYFDKNYGGQEYNAVERREQARAQYRKGHKFAGTSTKIVAPAPLKTSNTTTRAPTAVIKPQPKAPIAPPPRATTTRPTASSITKKTPPNTAGGGVVTPPLSELQAQVDALQLSMEGLEKERGFYFGKLREIEILLQEGSEVDGGLEGLKKAVLDILYQTDEAAEFQSPEEGVGVVEGEDGVAVEAVQGGDGGGGEGLLDDAELTEAF